MNGINNKHDDLDATFSIRNGKKKKKKSKIVKESAVRRYTPGSQSISVLSSWSVSGYGA